ncbi:chorismate dehydratase [Geothermobacter ehrlichii]|uniref:Chorismate dehydratase n=1 Tax=Geothermobacter ehrlichii TaxID=213224 RepID=A0A5D3WM95_9BACT|nr:menaquinone biosynthesis protein [Geothermobacter ehrlichii]TYO99970.1 chorismate dehydratase [Geothermobacter ehrlichii]
MSLRVGHICYLNSIPFFHHLRRQGFAGEIVSGVPAHLNAMLARGEIDLCPSSSFEYARNWRDYLLLPEQSISSFGPVRSVLLFSRKKLSELDGQVIAVTGESATSINLLKVLLREFHGCREVCCRVPDEPVEAIVERGGDVLMIGDRALKAGLATDGGVYDLGQLWWEATGLPFVFALWIVRREVAEERPGELAAFNCQLAAARTSAEGDLHSLASEVACPDWLTEEELVAYWQRMSFDLAGDHLRGLERYFSLCHRHGLLAEEPGIAFFSAA